MMGLGVGSKACGWHSLRPTFAGAAEGASNLNVSDRLKTYAEGRSQQTSR
jgi:hypothetical protein